MTFTELISIFAYMEEWKPEISNRCLADAGCWGRGVSYTCLVLGKACKEELTLNS